MQPKVLKYILDIESVIQEIEAIKVKTNNNFKSFQSDIILQRAIERDLEIIGEAIRKIIEFLIPQLKLHLQRILSGSEILFHMLMIPLNRK